MASMHRKRLLAAITALAACMAVAPALADPAEVHVYKSPDCGCCEKWIDHLRADGFSVRATDVPDVTPIKLENGVPTRLAACHTAVVGGYVVEGHVPAADIRRLLQERPDIAGLAVPGMPVGSPGMEGANPEAYQVLAFGTRGVSVFAEHGPR